MVRMKGLEPSHPCEYQNLNLARLPIPPHPHICHISATKGLHCRFNSFNILRMTLEPESSTAQPLPIETAENKAKQPDACRDLSPRNAERATKEAHFLAELRAAGARLERQYFQPRWSEVNLLDVPRFPGCYALLLDGLVVYVGQTKDLRMRFSAHGWKPRRSYLITKWGNFGDYSVKFRPERSAEKRRQLEGKLLRRLTPLFNIRITSAGGAA